MTSNDILNHKVPGYIVFLCNRLRDVSLIELRQGFAKEYDTVLNFYLDRMEDSIHARNIDLKKFEEVKSLSKQYGEYEILYSFRELYEIKTALPQEQDYTLVYASDDVVNSYNSLKTDFYLETNSGCFCQWNAVAKLLEIQREHLAEYESGSLLSLDI
ncbi:MAG: hypothetical protein AAF518_12500 [Spirochaetota bacterium]